MYKKIELSDTLIAEAINGELNRQASHIELIASENFVSEDVLKATGSVLTNKYGEGYPGRRYYGGAEFIDKVENLAIERAKKLFNVKHVNVQPYSGSVANASALATLAKPGAKILGMSLSSGGHLTHGYHISFSGVFYEAHSYDVDENGFLDYDLVEKRALEVKPEVIITGYSAYPRVIDFKRFRQIADKVGAKLFADISHIAGLVVANEHDSPIEHAHLTMTTTHKTLRGARGAILMTNDDEIAKLMNRWVFPGYQGGPLFHAIAGKAVAFHEALQPGFKTYAQNVKKNARAMANEFMNLKVPVITGGTDNHLFTINVLKGYGISGKEAELTLDKINITTNKNTIPHDTLKPMIASGVRIGSAAMTSRGFDENTFIEVARIIDEALKNYTNLEVLKNLKAKVLEITSKHPLKKSYF
ncbi:serine hydroxymethyltransferase [Mycoplasmopsis agassizii]|uniref:serine hydroxymethyltransferase n=1 Tax=Mycoplasmopsis agassizii TaxID=33922 RepID=UPI00352774BB